MAEHLDRPSDRHHADGDDRVDDAPATLPYTGYDSWLAAGLGFVLVAGGLGLRARLRRT